MAYEVADTAELRRVVNLPRRIWTEETATVLAIKLDTYLRNPVGRKQLRPVQAQALYDIGTYGGGFLPIRVGGGKTLISLLSCNVLQGKVCLLVVPAALKNNTYRAIEEECKHFRIPKERIRVESYEYMGRHGARDLLDMYAPDVIIFDEVHKVKNRKAAVTRRFSRYLAKHPETRVVAMSGTITRKSLCEYAHILEWTHRDRMPLPRTWPEQVLWAGAIDETSNARIEPGALVELATDEDSREADKIIRDKDAALNRGTEWFEKAVEGTTGERDLIATRLGFRRRLRETPGVVATDDRFEASSIYVVGQLVKDTTAPTEAAFRQLRDEAVRPDGWGLADGSQIWAVARQLALGFYYRWDPHPPEDWMQARKEWASFARAVLKNNRKGLDSEFQVALACTKGEIDRELYDQWKLIEPTFSPNKVAVWLDKTSIEYAAKWLEDREKKGGLCWVEHGEFGRELSTITGRPYHRQKGLDDQGNDLLRPRANAVIVSSEANRAGWNLQYKWSDNLIMSALKNAEAYEQLMGRTHREGQVADTVTFDLYLACAEHFTSLEKSIEQAKYIEQTTGQSQKLLYADFVLPNPNPASRRFR